MNLEEKEDWKEYYDFINKNMDYIERILHMEVKMSEDKELKVMESRVRAALEKCPQGKEILAELFPDIKQKEWVNISGECILEKFDSSDHCFLIREKPAGWGFWVTAVINPCPNEYKFEDGRIYRKQ